jgi:hypothetical protein
MFIFNPMFPDATDEQKWEQIKLWRNQELAFTDWTQLPDSPLSPELKQAWADYRQALRDIPQQANYPAEINMPLQPGQPLDDANNKS